MILVLWLVALLAAGSGPRTALLAVALGLVWVAPLVRDRSPRVAA
ncbi:hypothetical protein [Actinoplanes sp. G11-F43]